MSWVWLLWMPFPGAIVLVQVLCLISAAGDGAGMAAPGGLAMIRKPGLRCAAADCIVSYPIVKIMQNG